MRNRAWSLLFSCRTVPFITLASALSSSALAQQSVTQSPEATLISTILKDRDPKMVADGGKYFYFWRSNSTFSDAYADFTECYRFLPTIVNSFATVPNFVPWSIAASPVVRRPEPTIDYGLVGIAVGMLVAGPIERRLLQSRMRRCLEPRGYQRFPVAKAAWEKIIDGYSAASIRLQANLANGPQPMAAPLAVAQ